MSKAQMIEQIEQHAAELRHSLQMMEGVIVGHPWVIQLAPGAYLVPKGEGYGVGSVLRTVCYSPERIDAAVAHIQNQSLAPFPKIKKIDRRDALREEIAAHEDIARRLRALEAA